MRHGPMSEDPQFRTVSAPDEFGWTTDSAVLYVPVTRHGDVLGYLWSAVSDDAAGFAVRASQGSDALNASVAWVGRLRSAKAQGMTPLQALRSWAGAPLSQEARAALARYQTRVAGCFLGGALGDALGAPVEFDSLAAIRQRHGAAGITRLAEYRGRAGLVTDDTQLTLFTAEGLITAALEGAGAPANVGPYLHRSYLRWRATQELAGPPEPAPSWLAGQEWLYDTRDPGNACLSGLSSGVAGTLANPVNPDSKGCGAVMRSAPFGLQAGKASADIFGEAVSGAVLTHGHPSGYLAAGAFAVIVRALVDGASLADGVAEALTVLRGWPGHEETTAALTAARQAAAAGSPSAETVERLGAGWVAEEALAIGVYAALAFPAPGQARDALVLAVNHSGDSDSTGSVCGNLIGAWHGLDALPADWLAAIEGHAVIRRLAADFAIIGWPGWRRHADAADVSRIRASYPA